MAFLRKIEHLPAPVRSDAADPARYLPRVEPGRVVGVLLRRGWLVVVTTAIAVAAMFAYLKKAPRIYEATGSVYVSTQAPQVLDFQAVAVEESRDLEQLRSVEQGLASQTLLLRVIEANDLANAPDFAGGAAGEQALLGILAERTRVGLRRGTRWIDLAVEDTDPRRAKALVESIVAEYDRWSAEQREGITRAASEGLRREEARLREKMEASERRLQEYRTKNPVPGIGVPEGHAAMSDELAALNAQLTTAKAERLRLESEFEALKKFDPADPDSLGGLARGGHANEVLSLVRSLQDKEAEFARVKERYLHKHPVYREIEGEIALLQKNLADATRAAGQALEKGYRVAMENETKLQREVETARGSAVSVEGLRAEFAAMQREAEADRELHATVARRLRETSLAGVVPASILHWKDVPLVPEKPVKPRKKVMLPLAAAGGMFFGFILMLATELGDGRVRNSAAAARATGVPLLVSVPPLDSAAPGELVMLSAPSSPVAEAIRRLRSVLAPEEKGGPRTILFASARPGEGRSLCAMNYAASLALQGRRTLLLDADMRRPGLSRDHVHPDGARRGLSDYLSGQSDAAKACFPTAVPNLYLLSSGTMREDAAELLSGTRFPALLEEAYRWFDAVVIDTPPVSPSADALAIARYADRTCLVVRDQANDRRDLRRAANLLRGAGADLVGFVWNETPLRSKGEPFPAPYVPVCQPVIAGSGVTVAAGTGTKTDSNQETA